MNVTSDDIAQLLASSPPRKVPPPVARAVLGGRGVWALPVFGLIFGGMGVLFMFVFFPWRFADDWRLDSEQALTVPGTITSVSRTSLSMNRTRVMEFGFRFTPADGRVRQGVCYVTGQRWSANEAVTVRYLPGTPELARVEGARLSASSSGSAFVALFPLIGAALVVWFVVDRRRTRRLLREGRVTEATVVSAEPTMASVNRQVVHKIVITSSDLQGGRPVTVNRFKPAEVNLVQKHLREKQPVFVLYDPQKHTRVLFPEALLGDVSR